MDLIETFHAENTLNDMKDDTSWNINMEHAVKSRFHSYKKNYSAEYDSCFLNLDEVIKDLNDGITIEEIFRDKNYLRKGRHLQNWPNWNQKRKRNTTLLRPLLNGKRDHHFDDRG